MTELAKRRRALMGAPQGYDRILPPEYQEVKYITRGTGTAYIRTGLTIRNLYPTVFEMKTYPTAFGVYNGIAIEIQGPDQNTIFAVGQKNGIAITLGGDYSMPISATFTNIITTVTAEVIQDHTDVTAVTPSNTFTGTVQHAAPNWEYPNFLVGHPASNAAMRGRFYYVKVSQRGRTIIDMVPCYRKSDNKIGMYNFVAKEFYPATGEWTKGADVT